MSHCILHGGLIESPRCSYMYPMLPATDRTWMNFVDARQGHIAARGDGQGEPTRRQPHPQLRALTQLGSRLGTAAHCSHPLSARCHCRGGHCRHRHRAGRRHLRRCPGRCKCVQHMRARRCACRCACRCARRCARRRACRCACRYACKRACRCACRCAMQMRSKPITWCAPIVALNIVPSFVPRDRCGRSRVHIPGADLRKGKCTDRIWVHGAPALGPAMAIVHSCPARRLSGCPGCRHDAVVNSRHSSRSAPS